MEDMLSREARFDRVYRYALTGYLATGAVMAVVYFALGNVYLGCQSIGTLLMPLVFKGFYRVARIHRVRQVDVIVLLFTFLAYTLGVAGAFYKFVPYYDKIMHTLSGTLTMLLALPLFYRLKHNRQVEAEDGPLAMAFCLATALAVAGLWEIAEYFLSIVTGIDTQVVQATGVSDTMQDMIVCTLGALLALPSMLRYYRQGKGGFLMNALTAFVHFNPGKKGDAQRETVL